MVSNEMISDINMLGPGMMYRIVGDGNCTCVVTKDGGLLDNDIVVSKLMLHPKNLSTTASSGYILIFSC